MRGYIFLHGKWVKWADLVKLKREQRNAQKEAQLRLFENLPEDSRPPSQKTADRRHEEPQLFDK